MRHLRLRKVLRGFLRKGGGDEELDGPSGSKSWFHWFLNCYYWSFYPYITLTLRSFHHLFMFCSGERSGSEWADSGRGGGITQGHTHGWSCGIAGSTPRGCLPPPGSGMFVGLPSSFFHCNSLSILTPDSLKCLRIGCVSQVLLIPTLSMQIESLTLSEDICGAQSFSSHSIFIHSLSAPLPSSLCEATFPCLLTGSVLPSSCLDGLMDVSWTDRCGAGSSQKGKRNTLEYQSGTPYPHIASFTQGHKLDIAAVTKSGQLPLKTSMLVDANLVAAFGVCFLSSGSWFCTSFGIQMEHSARLRSSL